MPVPPEDRPDLLSRVLAEALRRRLEQPVVVKNQPGPETALAA
ncbi:hypothetical protein [Roseomonas chloroacetimidivorans]